MDSSPGENRAMPGAKTQVSSCLNKKKKLKEKKAKVNFNDVVFDIEDQKCE